MRWYIKTCEQRLTWIKTTVWAENIHQNVFLIISSTLSLAVAVNGSALHTWYYQAIHLVVSWNIWEQYHLTCAVASLLNALTPNTIFIQIGAHALIDAHPLHHQAPGRQKCVKLMIFIYKMHRSYLINYSYICNYSVLWWWFCGPSLSPSLCTNFKSCWRSVHYYYNEYGISPKCANSSPTVTLPPTLHDISNPWLYLCKCAPLYDSYSMV